jgi:hypothetical protein
LKRGEEIQEVKTQCAGAQEGKKKGMKKAKPAKRAKAKKRAPKPIPAPVAPSQSAPAPPLGGKEMAL